MSAFSLPIISIESPAPSTQSSIGDCLIVTAESPEPFYSIETIAEIAYAHMKHYGELEVESYANSSREDFYSGFWSQGIYYEVRRKYKQAPGLLAKIQDVVAKHGRRLEMSDPELEEGFLIVKTLRLRRQR